MHWVEGWADRPGSQRIIHHLVRLEDPLLAFTDLAGGSVQFY